MVCATTRAALESALGTLMLTELETQMIANRHRGSCSRSVEQQSAGEARSRPVWLSPPLRLSIWL